MKRYLVALVVISLLLASCKTDSKSSEETKILTGSEYSTLSGEFIYTDSAAVFKKKDAIYGVVLNEQAKDLIAQAKGLSNDPYASFDVTLQVSIQDNPEEDAWPELISIQNVIQVKPSSTDDSLRLNK